MPVCLSDCGTIAINCRWQGVLSLNALELGALPRDSSRRTAIESIERLLVKEIGGLGQVLFVTILKRRTSLSIGSAFPTLERALASLAIALLLVFGTALGQEGAKIKKWQFEGNETFSDKHLRKLITDHHVSRLSKLFLDDDPMVYQRDVIASDLKHLAEFYQREGFLAVEVDTPKIEFDRKKDEVRLTITIREGAPILVSEMYYDIKNISADDLALLQPHVDELATEYGERHGLNTNDRFRDSAVIIYQDSLNRLFSYFGYPYAEPEFELLVDTNLWQADILWHVDPGPLAIFGDVSVSGNKEILPSLIASMSAFDKGDRYDQRLVEKTQEQIYGLGVFQVVTVHPILERPPLPSIPARIDVREGPRYRIKFGAGYGREDRFRTFVDLRTYGYLGRARQLQIYARYSYIEPYHVRLTLLQPYLLHPRTSLQLTPFARRQNEKSFEVRRLGAELGVNHTFTRHLTGNANYVYETVKLVGDEIPVALQLGDTSITSYQKSSILFAGQFDNSVPMFAPDRGVFIAGQFTLSGLGFGSDFKYWKALAEIRKYREFFGLVLAGRFQIAAINQYAGPDFVPVEERLYAGGASSVRGWDRHELGPKLDDTPLGGNSSMEGSLELRFPIYNIFSGAVFSDFGNVWLDSFHYDIADLRYAAGVGIRVSTPIGPIRLDVARPIFDEESKVVLHINVGQAF